jgi:hypothetical protein
MLGQLGGFASVCLREDESEGERRGGRERGELERCVGRSGRWVVEWANWRATPDTTQH